MKSSFSLDEDINPRKIIIGTIVGVFGIIFFFSSYFIVGAGQSAVVFNMFTGVKDRAYDQGFHFKVPIIESTQKFEVRTQKYETDAEGASKDLQTVHTKIALNFHLQKENVPRLYKEIGYNVVERIVDPSIQETVKATTAKHIAEELITKRELIKEEIKLALKERLTKYYVIVDELSITNFDFSEEFNRAIESKVTAEQNALKEQNNLQVIEFQAQQKIKMATGEAEAIRIINEQLSQSPDYVKYMLIQKWDGKMPLALGSGSLMSISSMQESNGTGF